MRLANDVAKLVICSPSKQRYDLVITDTPLTVQLKVHQLEHALLGSNEGIKGDSREIQVMV